MPVALLVERGMMAKQPISVEATHAWRNQLRSHGVNDVVIHLIHKTR